MTLNRDHDYPEYRPPELPTGWENQDWLLLLRALDHYAREGDGSACQELRASQLVESIAYLHGTTSLGSTRFSDSGYFAQYARRAGSEQ